MNKKQWFWVIFFLGLIILLVYWHLPQTFFQQDEWSTFGWFIYWQSANFHQILGDFLSTSGMAHFTPFSTLIYQGQFNLWGLNFVGYAYSSLFLHFLNSLLVFYLAWFLLQKKYLALMAALLFSVNSVSHQAVSWISASVGTQGSAFFSLLSLIFLTRFVKNKKHQTFIFSLISFLISLLFKEVSIFLFLLIPLFLLLFWKDKEKIELLSKKILFPFLGLFLSYSILRIFLTWFTKLNVVGKAIIGKAALVTGWDVYVYRLIAVPLKAIVQSLIPANFILELSRFWIATAHPYFENQKGTAAYDLASQTIFADLISFILLILILALIWFIFRFLKKTKKKKLAAGFIFSIVFILTSALPFAFISGQAGYFTFFEPRNLYLTGIGSSFFLAITLFAITYWLAGKTKKKQLVYILMTFCLLSIFLVHITNIRRDINKLVNQSQVRKMILAQIKSAYPVLADKAVVYTESNQAYYGLPPEEKILPFQSGFGQTLLVWYQKTQPFPSQFFEGRFLWGITDEGYREAEGKGFGYFRDYDHLLKSLKENNLSAENVYAFRYDSQTNKLEDITDNLKNRMESSGMAAYISRPQPDKIILGFPDGQRRSFYSEEFIPTEIREVINLTNNKKWVAGDFIAQQTKKIIPGTEDYLITYNYGLEASYGGAYLVYHLAGNDTDVYHIPDRLYGYKVAGFSTINSPVRENSIMKKIVQKKDGSFEATLLSTYSPSQALEFTLLLNAKVLYYKPNEGINDITAGQYVNLKGDGKSKKFVIPLPGDLKSLRSYWESNDLRYQPKAFVDGTMTQIASWSGLNTPSLTIEFEKPPAKNAVIKIPILVTYAPKPGDIIKIVNY